MDGPQVQTLLTDKESLQQSKNELKLQIVDLQSQVEISAAEYNAASQTVQTLREEKQLLEAALKNAEEPLNEASKRVSALEATVNFSKLRIFLFFSSFPLNLTLFRCFFSRSVNQLSRETLTSKSFSQ